MLADTELARVGELRVDGCMTKNDLLMQFQADVLGSSVAVFAVTEMTATGAAYAAGLATGFRSGLDELRELHDHSSLAARDSSRVWLNRAAARASRSGGGSAGA